MVSQELQLMRTILERLECSFARQEAKLDKLLAMSQTASTELQQSQQPTPHSSTPFNSHTPSLEYPPSAVIPRMEGIAALQQTPQLVPPHLSTSFHNCISSLEYPPSAVPQRAPAVDSTHLPASTSRKWVSGPGGRWQCAVVQTGLQLRQSSTQTNPNGSSSYWQAVQ